MRRILLVDGDWTLAEALSRKLARYEVIHAPTAVKGLDLAARKHPDLAIIECLLPDLSGVDVLRNLHALLPTLPAFMISPYDDQFIRASVLRAGAREYFQKPLNMAALGDSIDGLFARAVTPADATQHMQATARDRALVDRAIAFMKVHYAERLSLDIVSREVGLSRFALCRKFKAVQRISFRDHLLHVRLTRALELLSYGRHSITEIAQMVGFSDLPRFDKVFKRATGSAPSAYRKGANAGELRRRLARTVIPRIRPALNLQ